MKQDLFKYLPSDIIINILSRLPVRTIVLSKSVCKSWLNLLQTDGFVKSHFAKSVPSLAVMMPERESDWCKVFEFKDEVDDVERSHDRRYNPLTKFDFDFPHRAEIEIMGYDPLLDFDFLDRTEIVGAANGLLLLHTQSFSQSVYICNPITREYVKLDCPIEEFFYLYERSRLFITYGFGASKITGQHKVVQIICESDSTCKCHVYTLETGSWTRFDATASFKLDNPTCGAFLNGNLHWISESIACFDLETECFTIFSAPLLEETGCKRNICALEGYLCVCDILSNDEVVIDIWLMKEYGVEKSWTKKYVIDIHPNFERDGYECICPIKVFKDGDILMLWGCRLFYYSSKTQTAQGIGMFESQYDYVYSLLLTPSFLSLKSLCMENVISF